MPMYEYICRECEKSFERPEHLADHLAPGKKKPKCPHCGSRKVEPQISTSFVKTARKS